MPAENLDLLKIIFLKVRKKSFNCLFQSINFEVAGFYLFISLGLIFFLLLSNSKFRKFVILYFKIYSSLLENWQHSKIIRIL